MITKAKIAEPSQLKRTFEGVKSFFHECWFSFVILILLIWVTFILETTRPFEYLKAALVDSFTTSSSNKQPSRNVLIVEISEDDYKNLFQAQSPLNPRGVFKLIQATKKLDPSVIGVDLDTSEPQWACGDNRDYEELTDTSSKVVWAQVPRHDHEREASTQDESSKIFIAPVLGGRLSEMSQMGLVRFPQDGDGYVRTFQSSYAVDGPIRHYGDAPVCGRTKDGWVPTRGPDKTTDLASPEMPAFFQVLAEAHARAHKIDVAKASKERQYLRFTESRYSFRIVDAGQLLYRTNDEKFEFTPLNTDKIDVLKKPIVLIGGSYPEARDRYYTPLGPMLGVELIANAVEVQLGKSTSVVSSLKIAMLDGLAGVAIILIYFFNRTRPRFAFFQSLLAMAIVVVVSKIYYNLAAAFLNFVPVMFGMVIHQMIEGMSQARELLHDLEEKGKRVAHLEKKLAHAQAKGQLETAPPQAPASGVAANTKTAGTS